MKKNLLRLIVAVSALGFLAAGCEKDPKNEGKEDQFINVSPDKIEAGFEEKVTEITVESNCSWTISKTDSEGTAVDWVKCDKTTGKDNTTFNVKVFKNETASARRATVTLASGDAKAFIDVTLEANPDPDKPDDPVIPDDPQPGSDPEPYGDVVKLTFDFTQAPFDGWPTAARNPADEGNKLECVYPLGGRDYTFVLADCGQASASQMFWAVDGTPRLAFGAQYRYLGLPVIDGYILCAVSCTSVLLNAASASFAPKIAISGSWRNWSLTAWK